MFATVRIHTQPSGPTLVVPSEAVVAERRAHAVFVSRGHGRFEPREIELGVRGDDNYQVLCGLREGEQIVTSGQFLLDSESRLKEAAQRLLGSNVKPNAPPPSPAGAH